MTNLPRFEFVPFLLGYLFIFACNPGCKDDEDDNPVTDAASQDDNASEVDSTGQDDPASETDSATQDDPTEEVDVAQEDQADDSDPVINCEPPPPLFDVVETIKVCQLTGETDRQLGVPAFNQTDTNFGFTGVDWGHWVEHGGVLWLLLGDTFVEDTHPHTQPVADPRSGPVGGPNPIAADSIAFTDDAEASDCIQLNWPIWPPEVFPDYNLFKPPLVDGIDPAGGAPETGVSMGTDFYIWFTGDEVAEPGEVSLFLTVTQDPNFGEFEIIYRETPEHFRFLTALEYFGDVPVLGSSDTGWVFLLAVREWLASDIYLAAFPRHEITDWDNYWFFEGYEDDCVTPSWTQVEADALAIVNTVHPDGPTPEGCVGAVSAHYDEILGAWVMAYGCALRSAEMRTAPTPWGPWSTPTTIFDSTRDGGYCEDGGPPGFMHDPTHNCPPEVTDPGRDHELGVPYAPALIQRYTRGDSDHPILFYSISAWNPYNLMLMATELERR